MSTYRPTVDPSRYASLHKPNLPPPEVSVIGVFLIVMFIILFFCCA